MNSKGDKVLLEIIKLCLLFYKLVIDRAKQVLANKLIQKIYKNGCDLMEFKKVQNDIVPIYENETKDSRIIRHIFRKQFTT